MKIAIISSGFFPVIDGITVTLWHRIKKLNNDGHEVLLFCPDYSVLAEIYPNYQDFTGQILPKVKVINLESNSFLDLGFERNVKHTSYKTVLEELQKFTPDLIHIDEAERLFWGFFKIPGIDFAKKQNIPCVAFFHTNFLEYGQDYFPLPLPLENIVQLLFKQFLKWLYNSYNLTLVSSEISYQKLQQWGVKNIVKSNLLGVDTNKFNPQNRQEKFWDNKYNFQDLDKQVKILFLGRLTLDKGWDFTINSFENFTSKTNWDNLALIIVGDGSMAQNIKNRIKKITPNLYLLGRISPENIPAIMANCDLHLTTSEKETFGLTIIEAFASGIPVIAPRKGGVMDSVQDGYNGLLFNPQDSNDFVSKLNLLINNPGLRKTLGANAYKSVQGNSWDNAINNLVDIWQQQIMNQKLPK
jgi:glycosyltransferase involved in cell wall biosynthesis